MYDKLLLAGRDIQYRAPDSWSRYTTPFDEIKSNMQHLNNPGIQMILVIKNVTKVSLVLSNTTDLIQCMLTHQHYNDIFWFRKGIR